MDKNALIEEACQELLEYGVWDGKKRIKFLVKKYLLKKKAAPEDLIFWPTGLLAAGLWHCRRELSGGGAVPGPEKLNTERLNTEELNIERLKNEGSNTGEPKTEGLNTERLKTERSNAEKPKAEGSNKEELKSGDAEKEKTAAAMIDLVLSAYYERWFRKGCPIIWLDDLLAGETLLDLYEEYRKKGPDNGVIDAKDMEKYRQAVEKIADFGLSYPTDETGSFPYRADQDNGFVFVDSIGLACPFLYRYGTAHDRPEAMETAVKQIVNFLAYGMDAATGLPYHGYSVADDCKYGIIGWGRAVGWLLRGMGGCMATQYGADRLSEPYGRLVDAVIAFQRRDGSFAWQLQAADGPADTSAAGMICAALKQGMELGVLEGAVYEQAFQAGKSAIEKSVRNGRVYNCSGECEGFGQYPQRYGSYPWALGPALML